MRPIFLPALNPGNTQQAMSFGPPLVTTDERLRGTPAFYPHSLLSYYYWEREKFTLPKEAYVFGDSGGYSIMTLGAAVDPSQVVRWQVANCTVGAHLDVPPRAKGVGGQRKSVWEPALEKTVINTVRALPMYIAARKAGTKFRWWGVCHGGNAAMLEQWYQKVRNVYSFDDEGEGWCFKPFPIQPINTASALRFIRLKKIRHAHFLMATGIASVAVLAALGPQTGLKVLTYDSSSQGLAGVYRRLMIAHADNFGWDVIEEKTRASNGEDRRVRGYLLEQCECAACKLLQEDVKTNPDLMRSTHLHWKHRMIFHNTLAMLRVFTALMEAGKKDPNALLNEVFGSKKAHAILRSFDGREPSVGVSEGTPNSLLSFI